MRARRSRGDGRLIPAFLACFVAGVATGWWLRGGAPSPALPSAFTRAAPVNADPPPVIDRPGADRPVATAGRSEESAIAELRRRDLRLPIDGADVERLKGMFGERRGGGARGHAAVDILAPRNTPIHAVEDGGIAKVFESKAGGHTVYQFDPTGAFCYYYAHLERYAPGLHEGERVRRGDVIGYVGTSGNAPPNTPHLHFAVFELGPERRWWKGQPLDPYLILRR